MNASNTVSVPTGLSRWSGKVALVTGASSGIGAAVALSLGRAGMKVALAGRNRRRLAAVARKISPAPRSQDTLIVTCDQTRMSENARLFRVVRKRWGGVDVLVNCAGMRGGVSLLDGDGEEMQAALNLNVSAALWCMREAVAQMRGKPEGAIVNLSSMVGHRVLPGVPALYAATKHALRVLTGGVRSEVALRKLPIKVAMISPGLTDTPWHRQDGGMRTGRKRYPHTPLAPRDVADAVCYVLATAPGLQVRDLLLCASDQPY